MGELAKFRALSADLYLAGMSTLEYTFVVRTPVTVNLRNIS